MPESRPGSEHEHHDANKMGPYVRGKIGPSLEMWTIGGLGRGDTEDHTGQANVGTQAESAGLDMQMAAAGIRQSISWVGPFNLALVGGAGMLSMATEEGARAVGGLEAAVSQGRLGVEVTRQIGAMASYLRVSGRGDGGDGQAGAGMEMAGGMRLATRRVDFKAQVRLLMAHSAAGYQEYGGMAQLLYKPLADGSGLRASLKPNWGTVGKGGLADGDGLLLGPHDLSTMLPTSSTSLDLESLAMESDLGYGFALSPGLLTLGARQSLHGRETAETVGLTFESAKMKSPLGRGLKLRLDYALPKAMVEGGPRFEMNYTLRF